MINVDEVSEVAAWMRKKAQELRDNAGYNGAMSDYGASALETQIDCFIHGFNSRFPPSWQPEIDKMNREKNPEYQEYLRLQKKFGK